MGIYKCFYRIAAVFISVSLIVACCVSCDPDSSLTKIKETGSLRIGYCSCAESEDAPFIIDENSEGMTGEPASKIASSLGVEASFIRLDSSGAYDRLMKNDVDCLWNCSPPPKELVSSVRTIETGLYYRQVIMVPENSKIERLADVKGKKLAVVSGSDAQSELHNASVMESSLKKIVICTSMRQVLQELESGKVQCAAVDEPIALYAAANYKEGSVKFRILETPIAETNLVIVTRAGEADLCAQIAEKYVLMSQKGKIEALCEKYGLSSILSSSIKDNPAKESA